MIVAGRLPANARTPLHTSHMITPLGGCGGAGGGAAARWVTTHASQGGQQQQPSPFLPCPPPAVPRRASHSDQTSTAGVSMPSINSSGGWCDTVPNVSVLVVLPRTRARPRSHTCALKRRRSCGAACSMTCAHTRTHTRQGGRGGQAAGDGEWLCARTPPSTRSLHRGARPRAPPAPPPSPCCVGVLPTRAHCCHTGRRGRRRGCGGRSALTPPLSA